MFAAQSRLHRRYQFIAGLALQDVPHGADGHATFRQQLIGMDGHENDASRSVGAKDLGGCRNPVEARHRDITDDDVRRQLPGNGHKGDAVVHLRDQVELRPQQFAEQFRSFGVVFGKQQSRVMHGVENVLSLETGGDP